MAAVIELINLALKDSGVIGEGQVAGPEVMTDCFKTFQQMIAEWQVQKAFVYCQKEIILPATSAVSYTIGPGGDLNVPRPNTIHFAFWRLNEIDFPLDVLNSYDEYESILSKIEGTVPFCIYYQPTFPLGTLYSYPQATQGEYHLVVNEQFPAYASIADNLTLPPEYDAAVRYSLAELFVPMFQTPARQDIAVMAQRARRIMKRNNTVVPLLTLPSVVLGSGTYYRDGMY